MNENRNSKFVETTNCILLKIRFVNSICKNKKLNFLLLFFPNDVLKICEIMKK